MPPTINSLQLKIIFQGDLSTPLVARWANTGAGGLYVNRLPAGTTEMQTRIIVDNPNAAEVICDAITFNTTSDLVTASDIVGNPVTLPPNSQGNNVPIRLAFNSAQPLDEIVGEVTISVKAVV